MKCGCRALAFRLQWLEPKRTAWAASGDDTYRRQSLPSAGYVYTLPSVLKSSPLALPKSQVRGVRKDLVEWVDEVAGRTRADGVVWCDGSEEERRVFVNQMLKDGTLIELDQRRYPNCYLHRS